MEALDFVAVGGRMGREGRARASEGGGRRVRGGGRGLGRWWIGGGVGAVELARLGTVKQHDLFLVPLASADLGIIRWLR